MERYLIVGFAGGGLGITRRQSPVLIDLLRKMPIEGAVHRGCNGMESMIHNLIRVVYPLIPVHVVPIAGVYSSVASQPLPAFPQTIIYEFDSPAVVIAAILNTVWGIVLLPEFMREIGDGWDLVEQARESGMPVVIIWPDGTLKVERNNEL